MRWQHWHWQTSWFAARQQPESVNHLRRSADRFEVVLEHNGVRWINDSKALTSAVRKRR